MDSPFFDIYKRTIDKGSHSVPVESKTKAHTIRTRFYAWRLDVLRKYKDKYQDLRNIKTVLEPGAIVFKDTRGLAEHEEILKNSL